MNQTANEQKIILKLTVNRDILVHALHQVMKAVTSKTTIPILTGIKLTVSDSDITLTGSDSNISIESTIPVSNAQNEKTATIEQPGAIVLQGSFFAELIKKLPEDDVEIIVDERLMTTIRSGSSEFNLNGLDPQEYPQLPDVDTDDVVTFDAQLLKDVIRQTVFAVSASEGQPVLTGAHWQIKNGELSCVATDGHRLAMRISQHQFSEDKTFDCVIPGKSLQELAKLIEDDTETVSFMMTESQILFKTDHLLFFSRLLEDNYPDTNRLIPQESKTDITVNKKTLLQAMERTWLLAREDRNHVVKLNISDNKSIEVTSQSAELGKVHDQVTASIIKGEDVNISFSAKFVIAALKAIDAAEVNIRFTGAMRPFLIQPVDDDSVLQLVLPVRSY